MGGKVGVKEMSFGDVDALGIRWSGLEGIEPTASVLETVKGTDGNDRTDGNDIGDIEVLLVSTEDCDGLGVCTQINSTVSYVGDGLYKPSGSKPYLLETTGIRPHSFG